MKLTVEGVVYERRGEHWHRGRTVGEPPSMVTGSFDLACLDALAAAEQSRADANRQCAEAEAYSVKIKTLRDEAIASRNRWRALATDARPYVDTSPDWLERFDAAKDGS